MPSLGQKNLQNEAAFARRLRLDHKKAQPKREREIEREGGKAETVNGSREREREREMGREIGHETKTVCSIFSFFCFQKCLSNFVPFARQKPKMQKNIL